MTFPQPVGMWTPMRFWQLTLDCFSREPHRRCSHQEHPESCRRHTPELGDVDKDPSTICPYDSGLFNVLRGSVCQMAQHIPYSLFATWTKDPHFQITKEVATQTSEDVSPKSAPRPSCVEKGVQCSTTKLLKHTMHDDHFLEWIMF